MGPAEVFIALIIIGLPVILLMIIANCFFKLRDHAKIETGEKMR